MTSIVRGRGARTWAVALVLALLGVLWAWRHAPETAPAPDAGAPAGDAAVQRLATAAFRARPDDPAREVLLPDAWGTRLGHTSGHGEYHLQFELPAAPQGLWALRLARVSPTRRLWINGTLVQDELARNRRSPLPALIDLPPEHLRAGSNELRLEVDYNVRGGLSVVELGPAGLMRQRHEMALVWEREVPRTANMATMVIALTMLMVRWRRPREVSLGLFGALGLIGALRNYSYFGDLAITPGWILERAYFCAQPWTALLLFAYARSLAPGRGAPRWLGPAMAAPVLLAAATPTAAVQALRVVVYPFVIGLALLAVREIWRAAHLAGGRVHYVLAASLLACVAAGVHDYMFQNGWLPITHTFALAYVMPVALSVNALILLDRMIASMDEAERLTHRLELRVAERTRELEAVNAAKTRFLAAASHDLRQPAATLGLLLEMVRSTPMAPALRALVERAHEAASTLGALLDRLLDLSRMDAPTRPPDRRPVAVQALFDAVAGHELAHARSRGLTLRFRPTAAWVHSDPALLEQILRNLVSNALRYTERGGVLVGLRRSGTQGLRLEVWDSGQGIAPEHHGLVFEEFAQLPSPAGRQSKGLGLGLGLAIVDRAARQLGHARGVRSRPGRGSCFWVELPRAEPAPREEPGAAAAVGPAGPAGPTPWPGEPTIWLVEDEAPLREALAELLARRGARVRAFGSHAALAAHLADAQEWPDALVCDDHLGDGNGAGCIALVRAGSPWPVAGLLITGSTAPQDLARQAALGVPVLHKPFDGARLVDALAGLLAAERFSAPA